MTFGRARSLTGAALFSLVLLLLFGLSVSASQVLSAGPLSSHATNTSSLGPLPTCSAPAWSIVPSQNPSTYTNYLQDVSALSESAAWSVGYYNTSSGSAAVSLVERWDGSQWSTVPVPHVGTSSNRLAAVEAIAPDNVWAVGHYRYVTQPDPYDLTLILHWNGAQWAVVPSPNVGVWNNFLYDISAVSPDDIWAVGSYKASLSAPEQTLTMHWDGSDWTIFPSPNPGTSYNILRGVTAISANDVWAVGYYDAGSNPDQTMILHWNGSQWDIVPSANAPTGFSLLYSVDASSSGDVWAVGYNSNPPGGQVRTLVQRWNGTSWNLVDSPNPGSSYNSLTGVSVVSTNDVWAVGNSNSGSGSQTMTLHWDGGAWTQSPSPNAPGGNWLNGVDAVSSRHVWAVGYSGSAGAYRTLALLYGGNDPCGTPGTPGPSTTAVTTSTVQPTQTPTPCAPSWNIIPGPNTGTGDDRLSQVAVISGNDIWAVGYTTVGQTRTLTLHWDGTEWNIVPSPNPGVYSNSLADVAGVASNDVWAVGSYRSSQQGVPQTLTLHWGGNAWNVVPSPNTQTNGTRLRGVTALASDNVWAVGEFGVLFPDVVRPLSMRWDGTQWSIISMPYGSGSIDQPNAISAVSPSDIWAVGFTFDGTRFATKTWHWDGVTWSLVPSPNPGPTVNSLSGVTAISSNDVWAVGSGPVSSPLILHWNGTQWEHVPALNVGSSSLGDVDALGSNDVWATGTYNNGVEQTLSLHWDGGQWSVVPSPNAGSGLNRLFGIAAVSADDVWAVGYYQDGTLRTLTERYARYCGTPTPTVSPSATLTATSAATSTGTSTATTAATSTATSCPIQFNDVGENHTFYASIRCLACRGIVSGYSDGTFRPNNQVTRGQLAKMVSNAAGFSEAVSGQTFADVSPTHTFYEWIERLTTRGHMTGYQCGGPGEPCINNMPYFRPFANATRGQTSKIVSNAAGFTETPVGQTFEDVPATHTFYDFIQRLATRNVMGGYPCGGVGEPCISGRPYFRPGNDVTRGQSSKIVANTFFPGCEALTALNR